MRSPNSNYTRNQTFGKQRVLNHVPRDQREEKLALTYLDKKAPDLIGMIMGHLL